MKKILAFLILAFCAFSFRASAQSSGITPPPPPYCTSSNAGALYTNTGTSPATIYTCSYYNLAWQWVVNPSYGGLVYYPTVPSTCSGALPVFLAGWPNTQEYVCVNGVPSPIGGGSGGGVTNFSAPSGSWPAWLVPTVTNPASTPSLAVAAGTVPLSNGGTGATSASGAMANLLPGVTSPGTGGLAGDPGTGQTWEIAPSGLGTFMQVLPAFAVDVTGPPYNAKCDGVTDDSAAIQACLDNNAACDIPASVTHSCVASSVITLCSIGGSGNYFYGNGKVLKSITGFIINNGCGGSSVSGGALIRDLYIDGEASYTGNHIVNNSANAQIINVADQYNIGNVGSVSVISNAPITMLNTYWDGELDLTAGGTLINTNMYLAGSTLTGPDEPDGAYSLVLVNVTGADVTISGKASIVGSNFRKIYSAGLTLASNANVSFSAVTLTGIPALAIANDGTVSLNGDIVLGSSGTITGAPGYGTLRVSELPSGASWTLNSGYNLATTLFSAAGTPLPTCNSSLKSAQTTASDATNLYGPYVSGGSYTAPVYCGYNGSSYAWQMDAPTVSTSSLTDWTNSGVANGYVPIWDAAQGIWSPGAQTGGGSGTVTVVGSGSLTSTALVTGGGTTTLQTPATTATMDSSGNISSPGTVAAGTTTPTTIGSNGVLLNGLPALQSQTSLNNYYSGGSGNLTGTGGENTANGLGALHNNTGGFNNAVNGVQALSSNTNGYQNAANGVQALYFNTTGNDNTANGYRAGIYISDGSTANQTSSNSVYEGFEAYPLADGDTNENVIGNTAIGHGSNTTTLGNASVTDTYLAGTVHGTSFTGNAATATTATNFSGSLAGDVTGTQGGTSVVKINGAAVPASASVLGTNSSGQPIAATAAQIVSALGSTSVSDITLTWLSTSTTGLTLAGTAPASVSTATGTTATTLFNVNGVAGGATSNASGTGGVGSSPAITSGAGGAGTGTNASGGAGGNITLTTGVGGSKTGSGTAGANGQVLVSLGGGTAYPVLQVICSGQISLSSGSPISSGGRATNTLSCTGLSTSTDSISCTFSGDTNTVTGYAPSATGAVLSLKTYVTSGTINVDQMNNTASSITPSAATLNCKGLR